MKKVLIIGGTIYTAVCIGMCVWMIVDPEGYGGLLGSFMRGYFKAINAE